MIPPEQIEQMKEKFLGKRVVFKTHNGKRWVGKCTFLGHNEYLPSWGFQVTIDRLPLPHVIPDTIELF